VIYRAPESRCIYSTLSNDLAVSALQGREVARLEDLARQARGFIEAAKAQNSRRAYRSDWRHFESWCRSHGLACLPAAPETVALYLTDLAADHKPASLDRNSGFRVFTFRSRCHPAVDPASRCVMYWRLANEWCCVRLCFSTPQHTRRRLKDLGKGCEMSKQALITASASGIGAVTALAAKAQGYEVVISDIDRTTGQQLASAHRFHFVACDLASEHDIVTLVREVGPVSLLVNNGGIAGPTALLTEVSREQWQHVFDINVTAQFLACREMVPLMRASGGGCIINISSVAAKIGYPKRAPYAASKWAVLGLTATRAREVGADGIRVNAVLPGPVRGTRAQKVIADYAKANRVSEAEAEAVYLNRQATGRYVEPEEVAATILYLASDAARSITGQFVSVDGGFQ